MKKIYLLWCTIRVDMFNDTCKTWMSMVKHKDRIVNKIAVLTEDQKIKLNNYGYDDVVVVLEKGYNTAATFLTKNLEVNDDDIVMLPSDDFYPGEENWDEYIFSKFENYDGALFLNDRFQDVKAKDGMNCITLACMTYSCLKKINKIIFNPEYSHFFSDNEAFRNLKDLGLLKDDRDIDSFHVVHTRLERELDQSDREHMESWGLDHKKFDNRMTMSISERLK